MKTEWKNWNTGENAKLHKLESGLIFAVFADHRGFATRESMEFTSTVTAKEFFTTANGWH